jgi:RNA polymerase sigma-70 factor (ECF subfamily)
VHSQDFERLYAEHAEPMLRFLIYRTGDQAVAEDLLADTFERVLTARKPFDPRRASEKTWLYTIALNLLRDNARRTSARQRALERVYAAHETAEATPDLDAIEQRDELQRALSHLSGSEREVVALRFGADLSIPEIAKLTNEKLSTTEGRVYRALRKLKQELE